MSTKSQCAFLVTLGAMLVTAPAAAQSLQCNNDLVSVGDNKAIVQMKCGEPTSKDSFCKPNSKGQVCESVEEWTYNKGSTQLMRTLRFESGRLVSITHGDYGR